MQRESLIAMKSNQESKDISGIDRASESTPARSRRVLRLWTRACVLIAASATNASGQSSTVAGTWEIEPGYNHEGMAAEVILEQAEDSIWGAYASPSLGQGQVTGSVDGSTVVFRLVTTFGGQRGVVTYQGEIDGDAMAGTVDLMGFVRGRFTAQRSGGG